MKTTTPPRRKAFTITEMIMVMPMVLLALALGAELLHNLFRHQQLAERFTTLSTQADAAVSQLRMDAWQATAIGSATSHRVDLTTKAGAIAWEINEQGDLTRTAPGVAPHVWPEAAARWSFDAEAGGLNITDAAAPGSPPVHVYSQILLAGGHL